MSEVSTNARHWTGLFPKDNISPIFRMIWAASHKISKKNNHELENHITKRLFRAISSLSEYRSSPYRLHPQFYIISENEPESDGQVDIVFAIQDLNTYFAIEAKRLHVTSESGRYYSLVSEYVSGDQGMMCFINQKYSKGLDSGAMLGYVFDGNLDKARNGIAKSIITNAKKLNLSPPKRLVPSTSVDGSMGVSETIHRIRGKRFTIYHMLVSV